MRTIIIPLQTFTAQVDAFNDWARIVPVGTQATLVGESASTEEKCCMNEMRIVGQVAVK